MSGRWKRLVESGRIEVHEPTAEELHDLRSLVDRNLGDAAITQLSHDRRFGIAYEAVIILCRLVITDAGYRVRGHAGHVTSLEAARLALGSVGAPYFRYFEHCRRRRNQLNYETAGCTSRAEADELLVEARRFRAVVDEWIANSGRGDPE